MLSTASAGLVTLFRLDVPRDYYWAHHVADCVMFVSVFVLAVHAVLVAKTTLARRRALLFATAFDS